MTNSNPTMVSMTTAEFEAVDRAIREDERKRIAAWLVDAGHRSVLHLADDLRANQLPASVPERA